MAAAPPPRFPALLLGLLLRVLGPTLGGSCTKPAAPTNPIADLPPWPASSPPQGMGCYSDHAPQKTPGKTRLLTCGVPNCAGNWGCGGGDVRDTCPKDKCPTWPAPVPKCTPNKMTRAYCIQLCLAWAPHYNYAGTAYGKECWCGAELDTYGSDDHPEAANLCVEQKGGECSMKCAGDNKQFCGGNFFQDVFEIRTSLSDELETGSWWLLALVACGGTAYLVGGMVYGARGARPPASRGRGGYSLRVHPHYGRWVALRGLCGDGVAFTLVQLGLRSGRSQQRRVRGDGGKRRASQGPLLGAGGGGEVESVGTAKSGKGGKSGKKKKRASKGSARGAKTSKSAKGAREQARGDSAVTDADRVSAPSFSLVGHFRVHRPQNGDRKISRQNSLPEATV